MPDLTYGKLAKAVEGLTHSIVRDGIAIKSVTHAMSEEAAQTYRTAQAIASMFVDTATISETHELAKQMSAQSEDCGNYASAADSTGWIMVDVREQNRASHRDIGTAAQRSPVGADIYNVNREWFRQE
jgi:hypothetical protein